MHLEADFWRRVRDWLLKNFTQSFELDRVGYLRKFFSELLNFLFRPCHVYRIKEQVLSVWNAARSIFVSFLVLRFL